MRKLILIIAIFAFTVTCAVSCKAWRTITTSSTYTQQNDSAKTTTTIATKTVEEYQGVRKR